MQYGTVDISGSENWIVAEKITYHENFTAGGAYPNDVAVIKVISLNLKSVCFFAGKTLK